MPRLFESYTGGPHGVGDPDDRRLRRSETEILIPELMRRIAREEKCAELRKAFEACSKEHGLLNWLNCRKETKLYTNCLREWFFNSEFRQECTEKYLDERSEYRRTGISKYKDLRSERYQKRRVRLEKMEKEKGSSKEKI